MSGEGCLNSYTGRFRIAYLADQYYIRVKAEYRPQATGKSYTSLRINLNLINFLKPILSRVLDGNYIPALGIKVIDGSIQGGSLASAGRPANQNHSVRNLEHFFELLQAIGQKPKLG